MVVGVNRFRSEQQTPVPVLRVDAALERAQIERVGQVRARRDPAAAARALAELEAAARSSRNLMPLILAAVEAYCTVGEISDALGRVFGAYRESVVV